MTDRRTQDYVIEAGPMGPIGEGAALILRVNRNCPWNKCLFCSVYKEKNYSPRSLQEIKDDIDTVRRICDLLVSTSREIGHNGRIGKEVARKAVRKHPEIYGEYPDNVTQEHWCALLSLNNVANWLMNGAERVFLQDSNALAIKPAMLAQVLQHLKGVFPTVNTITSYARSKTCEHRSIEELRALKEAGLSWCFVGIESGCDEVLDYMKKGVNIKEHIEGSQKLMAAGINTAAFVMPGLSGNDKTMVKKHISDTLTVLNKVRPNEVRVRSLAILEGTPLYDKWQSGEFLAADEDQLVEEIRSLIEGIMFDCIFETLQMTNPLFTVKGTLSQIKSAMLEKINWYQNLSPVERARFLFHRYVSGGYLDWVKAWGKYESQLKQMIKDAEASLTKGSEHALEKTGRAIFAIKSKGIP
jgi:radical SAM superfamily enzyme YgiQ (UPF0313 family)